jgi:hypothetical protein
MDLATAATIAGTSVGIYQIIQASKGGIITPKIDDFLNYDPGYLLNFYESENHIDVDIPYSELLDLDSSEDSLSLSIKKGKFKISEGGDLWAQTSRQGYAALIDSGRVKGKEPAIRLSNVNTISKEIIIQSARYHDQCKSNLIMDFKPKESSSISLREQLMTEHGSSLPKIEDSRLANTIGIAALIFYKDQGEFIPYMVRRVKKVGVFPGGLHCTSSGVAKWPSSEEATFENYFTNHMYSELKEEVGLNREDIKDLTPMALCREYARGGKPQIFYAGVTDLNKDDLIARRNEAARVVRETNLWPEVEKKRWYQKEAVYDSLHLRSSIKKYKVTLEGAGSLFYGIRYLNRSSSSLA